MELEGGYGETKVYAGTVYNYFASKDELAMTVMDLVMDRGDEVPKLLRQQSRAVTWRLPQATSPRHNRRPAFRNAASRRKFSDSP